MIFTATLPVAVYGTRIGHQHRGTRRYTFWQEFDVRVPSVKSEAAPIVASWDASFDERLVYRTNRADWGAYPDDGQQHVRFHNGQYWRQALHCDLADGPLSSPVFDAGTFAQAFDRPENNRLLSQAPLPTVGRGKPVVRDIGEYMDLVRTFDDDYKAHEALTAKIGRLGDKFLVVDDTVYVRCAEPMIELSDCAVLDRHAKACLLLRVITDGKELGWRSEKTPHRLFPLSEFDEAMAAAAEPGFESSAGIDQATGVDFNETRRPHIARHDLLTGLDHRSFQAFCALRNFAKMCDLTDRVDHYGEDGPNRERTRLHRLLVAALKDHEAGDTQAFGRIEDLLPSLHAAWHGTYLDMATGKVMALLDERPIFLPHVPGGPKP